MKKMNALSKKYKQSQTFLKRNSDILAINLTALVIGIALYFYLKENVEILAALIVTGVSLSLGTRQYKTENDRLFKELFQDFNAKYDLKFNETLNKIDSACEAGNEYELSPEEKLIIIDYLNFCSEEYLWYRKNRIPEEVWASWEDGMVYYLNLQPINVVAISQKNQKSSFYGLWDRIGKRVKNW